MQHETTPFVAESERPLVRDALLGIVGGIVAFGLVTVFIVKLGWPDQSWGFAFAIGAFVAPWAGVFFGSATGIAVNQAQAAKAARAAASVDQPADAADSAVTPPSAGALPPLGASA